MVMMYLNIRNLLNKYFQEALSLYFGTGYMVAGN